MHCLGSGAGREGDRMVEEEVRGNGAKPQC